MQKILKAQTMGNSISIPLKVFGLKKGKSYLVVQKETGGNIIISEVLENASM